jgi:hypothetical protein
MRQFVPDYRQLANLLKVARTGGQISELMGLHARA